MLIPLFYCHYSSFVKCSNNVLYWIVFPFIKESNLGSAIVFSYISLTYFNLEKFPQILFIFYDTGAFKRILHPFLSFNTTVSYFGIAQSFLMIKIRLHFPRWNRRDVCVLLRVLLLDIHSVHLPLIGDVNFDYWVKVLLTLSLYSYYFFSCNY